MTGPIRGSKTCGTLQGMSFLLKEGDNFVVNKEQTAFDTRDFDLAGVSPLSVFFVDVNSFTLNA